MPTLTGSLLKYPARVSFGWYLGMILVGASLLMLPACGAKNGRPISFLDAVFTATSASCVTGLTVRSTELDYSFAGQMVVLLLIQLGGIGIITVTTWFMLQLRAGETLGSRLVISETLGADAQSDLRSVLRRVILVTLLIETLGASVLLARHAFLEPLPQAAWHAVFHSISAFCNAGFSVYDDNLERFRGDVVVNFTICALIILGGIGYPVLLDLWRVRALPYRQRWARLQLHSKLMLLGTPVLLFVGASSLLVLENDGVLAGLPWWERVMAAFFHSTSTRTAGFNTLRVADLTNATLFITVLLMAIGGGPCSTAGGFKVSTGMVMALKAWFSFRGSDRVTVFRRTIPRATIERAMVTTMLFGVVAVVAITLLLVIEQSGQPHVVSSYGALDVMFEVISAQGTVGLSTGMTTHLSSAGRWIIVLLMFIGRLGPISVVVALSRGQRGEMIEHANEAPLLG